MTSDETWGDLDRLDSFLGMFSGDQSRSEWIAWFAKKAGCSTTEFERIVRGQFKPDQGLRDRIEQCMLAYVQFCNDAASYAEDPNDPRSRLTAFWEDFDLNDAN
jgi:hypothetical protein